MRKYLILLCISISLCCNANLPMGQQFRWLIEREGVSVVPMPDDMLQELGANSGFMTMPQPNETQIFYPERVEQFLLSLPEEWIVNDPIKDGDILFYFYQENTSSPAEVVVVIPADGTASIGYVEVNQSMAAKCKADLIKQVGKGQAHRDNTSDATTSMRKVYPKAPQSAINAWHKEYYKDAYGDYDYRQPYLLMALDYSQDGSCIIGVLPDCFVISLYGTVVDYYFTSPELYISAKKADGQVINLDTVKQDGVADCLITEPESMRQFLNLLREGNFRLLISDKPNSHGELIPVKRETIGVWEAMQEHLSQSPNFYVAWGDLLGIPAYEG